MSPCCCDPYLEPERRTVLFCTSSTLQERLTLSAVLHRVLALHAYIPRQHNSTQHFGAARCLYLDVMFVDTPFRAYSMHMVVPYSRS